jgi:hypothetical protein
LGTIASVKAMAYQNDHPNTNAFSDTHAADPLQIFPEERVARRFVRQHRVRQFGRLLISGLGGAGVTMLFLQPSVDQHSVPQASGSNGRDQGVHATQTITTRTGATPLPATSVAPTIPSVANEEAEPQLTARSPGVSGYRGSLSLRSYPSGARVLINGRAMGKTPMQLRNLGVGSRAVKFALDGYESWSSAVTVTAGRRTDVVARLKLIRHQPVQRASDPVSQPSDEAPGVTVLSKSSG